MTEYNPTIKQKGREKTAKIPIKIATTTTFLKKPDWIRIKATGSAKVAKLKAKLRESRLFTVCEEASCPNLNECFSKGTATFMIMGDKCTRRCTFCDVGHGRPDPLDAEEPINLAKAIKNMELSYVVITSVDRDDLRDGGAEHFANCINNTREISPKTTIEVLVPDFRGRMDKALDNLAKGLPDVFNHNVETVPTLYKSVRPGSDYQWSLDLIKNFKARFPEVTTKSGLMVGLGENNEQLKKVIQDLHEHNCEMLTIGQYLQPSRYHAPVKRYMTPEDFDMMGDYARSIGFKNVASGPLVRSSYHADKQASGEHIR
ncbi:MAG: lipoyl synthase [Francisellaceae bacterium]|nr:lipoyl synthase [Francisellaceae bacterium]MBT6207597.1 lipoyl synthase [Francisellaceae bacterium]MBT6539721.1 lipoyl synthase [Francisellaceae bacterium]